MKKKFRPGDYVPESGIYRINHDSHRLMHEATLIHGTRFPRCRVCRDAVRFELSQAIQTPTSASSHRSVSEGYPDERPSRSAV